MTLKLSNAMQQLLKAAPDYWTSISPTPTVTALEKRGLVELRTRPGERGFMAGYQWRITETGCDIDGRRPKRFEVTVWDHKGDIVKKEWEATADVVDEIERLYADDPLKTVVVEERP